MQSGQSFLGRYSRGKKTGDGIFFTPSGKVDRQGWFTGNSLVRSYRVDEQELWTELIEMRRTAPSWLFNNAPIEVRDTLTGPESQNGSDGIPIESQNSFIEPKSQNGNAPLLAIEEARKSGNSFYIEKSTSIYNYSDPEKFYANSTSRAGIEFPSGPLNQKGDKIEVVFLNTLRNRSGEVERIQRVKTFVNYTDVRW
jgi:hypothetical protein